jgi:hypothetical protein
MYEIAPMPLHYTLAAEPPAWRRFRLWAPLLLLLWLIAVALSPGFIAGDRPFQTSLCDDLVQVPEACASLERTLSAVMNRDGAGLAQRE